LGKSLATWIDALPSAGKHHACLKQVTALYGGLDDFERILADLMTCPPGSPAEALGPTRPYLLSELKEAIRDYFDSIRSAPAGLYDELTGILRPGDTVITFNYDLGIERALHAAGKWDINNGYGFSIGDREQLSPVNLLKLHGSTNWRALLFGARTGFFVGNGTSLGSRPVLYFRSDLEYLGYEDFIDPNCSRCVDSASLPAMIMPALPKIFYFDTTFGQEWDCFWNRLWQSAESAAESAGDLVVIGYSLPIADERARTMLLDSANKAARLTVCCGDDTARLEEEFRDHGFSNIRTGTPKFEDFLARAAEEYGVGADGPIPRKSEQVNTLRNACLPAEPDDSVIPLESEEIKRESIDRQVFIFNVGPFSHARPMGSYGTVIIPALEVSACLHADLRVAGPVTIPGRPSECYPDPFSEKWRRLYHQPIDGTPPAVDFALQVIGAGRRGAMSGDLRSDGVFISQDRVPNEKVIKRAQKRLRETAQARCEYLSQRWQVGGGMPITERDRLFARLLNDDFAWARAYDAEVGHNSQ
jgi:hypothetical protein